MVPGFRSQSFFPVAWPVPGTQLLVPVLFSGCRPVPSIWSRSGFPVAWPVTSTWHPVPVRFSGCLAGDCFRSWSSFPIAWPVTGTWLPVPKCISYLSSKMEAGTFLQFEKQQKACNCHQKPTGHVFPAHFFGHLFPENVLILGGPGDFPYCRRCVLAGPKREPTKQSLWEKTKKQTTSLKNKEF